MARRSQSTSSPTVSAEQADSIDAEVLRTLLVSGTAWLERNSAAVDALNVFPVPDGDTGKNMVLTMRAAVDAARRANASSAGQVMRAASRGAVMGARGNSGVILSQIVAGMAHGLDDLTVCDGRALARALTEGAETAYRAVTVPVEGTILTVARAAGEAAMASVEATAAGRPSCRYVLEHALAAAQAAVERTPELLAVLRQAGVVDAGGEGYRIILEGMLFALRGEALPDAMVSYDAGAGPRESAAFSGALDVTAIPDVEWGYCTQFVIQGDHLEVARLRHDLQQIAESALVVGDDRIVRVHGHTEDPGHLLSFAIKYGRLHSISIEDMDAQHDEWLRAQAAALRVGAPPLAVPVPAGVGGAASEGGVSGPEAPEDAAAVAVATIAVAPGAGCADVLRSLGVSRVVMGGQTMNPSAGDLLEAARATGARTVIVLPNNGNVVMTAQQAASLAEGQRLLVVPSKTLPQGIAAQLAFDPESDPEEAVTTMTAALKTVRTVEVTRATRSVTLDGVEVQAGDVLGLVDDRLVAAGQDVCGVTCRAMHEAGANEAEIITIYRGDGVTDDEASAFLATLRDAYPRAEIEVVAGGQPHYDYIISVE